MSYNIALTGLNAASEQLGTISNNIANVGTVGFKGSRTDFASVYAETQAQGVEVVGRTQSITQSGSIVGTGRTLDLAIAGGGFFTVRDSSGQQAYTRAGVFNTDRDDYVVSATGDRLQGYSVNAEGTLQTGAMGDIQLQAVNLPASATDQLDFVANLDANHEVPAVAFDPDNVDSFNSTYTSRVYDSLGREHTLTQYFVKTGDNAWNAHYYVDGASVGGPEALSFDTEGALTAPVGPVAVAFNPGAGAAAMNIDVDYTGTTQYGTDFVVNTNRANGYTAGEQTGLAVEKDGRLYATYSNGQRMLQGQLVLANFVNPQGLQNVSGTKWVETDDSGAALFGAPGVGQYGEIAAGSLENSNVDLTEQLVGLMEGQRNYQANTKVLSTDRELIQVLFNAV